MIPIRVRSRILLVLVVVVSIVALGQVSSGNSAGPAAASPKRTCQQIDACRRAVAWQRGQTTKAKEATRRERMLRFKVEARTVNDVTRDAIHWAAQKYGGSNATRLERQMIGIGLCESHLWPWATNGQFMSWAQLSSRHRSDPVITRLTWRDPYAVADHVARYILRYGEGEWQCRSGGGLRW